MKDVTGLFVVVLLLFLLQPGAGAAPPPPESGQCFAEQCFAEFREESDFVSARDKCAKRGGHLMTPGSSVTVDILYILLRNSPGRYWIGLRRKGACPDPDVELRGFEWVTEDTRSDFSNWAPGFDHGCSSPGCVSVSRQSDFKWTQEPCAEQMLGFLCQWSFADPCRSLAVVGGGSVSYLTPMGFRTEDPISLPPGSIATRMPSENTYVCFGGEWRQAPWSCEVAEGGCEYKCAVDPKHVLFCYCPPGQIVNPANRVTCEEPPPDHPCKALRCAHACHANGDSYECMCDQGFKLAANQRSCVDFNDCTDHRQCPGEEFQCVNTVGGFQCVCKDGYAARGPLCVDVDECASAPCEHQCANAPGSYECSCFDGYRVDPQMPNRCKLHCGKEECPAECDPNDAFQCYCPDGYVSDERGTSTYCVDMDECEYSYCDQLCVNTYGGYVCSCEEGYRLENVYQCVEIEGYTFAPGGPTTPTAEGDLPTPEPTRRPSGLSTGAFIAVIVCTTLFIVLVVFTAHRVLSARGRGEVESAAARKAREGETHGLEKVASDA